MFSLKRRVALVTGSGDGLGKAMATAIAHQGATVVINGRPGSVKVERTVDELTQLCASVGALCFDVNDRTACAAAIDEIHLEHGGVDILINNVGFRDRRVVDDFEPGAMTRMLDANLAAPFELARLAAVGMAEKQWGRIINVSSVVAQIAGIGDSIYIAAKGGLEALTRALAAEYGSRGITVNTISPGFFATAPNKHLVEDADLNDWLKGRTALGRWAEPEEIAGMAVFLASDESSFVTGQTFCVDGGMVGHL